MASKVTSEITILSNEHGRLRREQRDISKRDLQVALKRGERKRCYKGRWMITHDGLIFITNETMTSEITAYPAPYPFAPLDAEAERQHQNAVRVLAHCPALCKSHTVLVIDNSESMGTHDIPLYKSRLTAAYQTMAVELVAEQLFSQTGNNSDVVSLIQMGDMHDSTRATVVFKREPISWILYNKLLAQRDLARPDFSRYSPAKLNPLRATFVPALQKARFLLEEKLHPNMALSIVFVSAGASSDRVEDVLRQCQEIATQFKMQLSFRAIGYADASTSSFETLRRMVLPFDNICALSAFEHCTDVSSVSTALSSVVSSVMSSRLLLSTVDINGREPRNVSRETVSDAKSTVKLQYDYYNVVDTWGMAPALDGNERAEYQSWFTPKGTKFAVRRNIFGEGAERIVYGSSLCDGHDGFVGTQLVSKLSKYVHKQRQDVEFHKMFCTTQYEASLLAAAFNDCIKALPGYNSDTTPVIKFLDCTVYVVWHKGEKKGFLTEKMLGASKYIKWNSNGGYVNGQNVHQPIDTDIELKYMMEEEKLKEALFAICEGDADTDDENEEELKDDASKGAPDKHGIGHLAAEDFVHAFSHFTHMFTKKKKLVCDLQGVFNSSTNPPTFELTDPAIHYASSRNRRAVYGMRQHTASHFICLF